MIALVVVDAADASLLSALFSSPDEKPVTVADWASTAPEGLPRHGGLGARRHERRRRRTGRRTRTSPAPARTSIGGISMQRRARRPDPDRPREGLRARPALDPGADRPAARGGARRVPGGAAAQQQRLDAGVRRRARRTPRSTARQMRARARRLRAGAGADGAACSRWPRSGGLDGALVSTEPLLPDRLHQAAAVPRRRHLPREPRRAAAPARRASGG